MDHTQGLAPSAAAISREEIARVDEIIRPHIRRTPVVEVDAGDFGLDTGHS